MNHFDDLELQEISAKTDEQASEPAATEVEENFIEEYLPDYSQTRSSWVRKGKKKRTRRRINWLALISLLCGIASVACMLLCCHLLSPLFALLSVLFAIIAMVKERSTKVPMATVGIVLAALSIFLFLAFLVIFILDLVVALNMDAVSAFLKELTGFSLDEIFALLS